MCCFCLIINAEIAIAKFFLDDEDDENSQLMEELMKDPIFQTNMEDTLTKFLQNFSREEYFREFTSHLTQTEKHTLQSIQVTV